jgi:hypothetical protein
MKLFACDHCQQLVFFESVSCTNCGSELAYLPDRGVVSAQAAGYRTCANRFEHGVCNWAVPQDDPEPFCRSCRLNQVIPNLGQPGAKDAWSRLEAAKRRCVYTLLDLGLPVDSKAADPDRGLAFAFLADQGAEKVYTGHSDGVVTINIAEADDPFREQMRVQMGEPYRTLLGHVRHEIGHYYWERLIAHGPWCQPFRQLFGDERADYAQAQQRHYAEGPRPGWGERFVSAYASMHPWEDWAETWAHYLHMTDTLETARAYGLALKPKPTTGAPPQPRVAVRRLDLHAFDDLIGGWLPLTMAMNSLNRSMGLPDSYPFVLSDAAIAKLRFVHDVIEAQRPVS